MLNFPPYTKDQITKILNDRLSKESEEENIVEPAAVRFCATKVAAFAGDMRKALDICRFVFFIDKNVWQLTLLKDVYP